VSLSVHFHASHVFGGELTWTCLVLRLATGTDNKQNEYPQSSFFRRRPDSLKDRSLLVIDMCARAQESGWKVPTKAKLK